MSELIDHAIYYLRDVVGLHADADAVAEQRRELISLRAELTEARRQLKEASEQNPVAYCFASEIAQFNDKQFRIAQMHNRKCSNAEIALYTRAHVPQPAVPDYLLKECAVYLEHFGRADLASELRAILSATDSEVKNG